MITVLISAVLCLAYAMLIAAITVGWYKLKEFKASVEPTVKISVVIAVRNEEANIAALLGRMMRQDYPPDSFEIIISDDYSTDTTIQQVEEFIAGERER